MTGAAYEACEWCHPLTGREPGRPVTAGCVHEHLTTLALCDVHERGARTHDLWCKPCADAGHDKVPVRVLTPLPSAPSQESA